MDWGCLIDRLLGAVWAPQCLRSACQRRTGFGAVCALGTQTVFSAQKARALRVGFVAIPLFILPGLCTAQNDPSPCAESTENATIIIPDTVALSRSVPPSAIAVFSPEDECAGIGTWEGTSAVSVAQSDNFGTDGLETGDPLQFRIYYDSDYHGSSTGRKAQGSFVECSDVSPSISPICRDDGTYEQNTVHVLRKLTISQLVQNLDVLQKGENVELQWKTLEVSDGTGFEVHRKTTRTGKWERVGFVNESGDASEPTSYRFVDEGFPYEADSLFYRLEQVGTDGTLGYSQATSVAQSAEQVQLLGSYPNPASHQALIRYAVPEHQNVRMSLYDVLGRQIRIIMDRKTEGRHEMQLDVSRLPSGTYFLRLETGSQTRTQKLMVVR